MERRRPRVTDPVALDDLAGMDAQRQLAGQHLRHGVRDRVEPSGLDRRDGQKDGVTAIDDLSQSFRRCG